VKGAFWFSLIDKVYRARNLSAAFAKVKAIRELREWTNQTIEDVRG